MRQQEYRPDSKVVVAAVLAVAAAYVYFLIFAQFGFLRAVQAGAPGAVKSVMGVMGLAGVAGSVLAARVFAVQRSRQRLKAGFFVCAAAAGLALSAGTSGGFHLVSLLLGLGTGFTTVTLAGVLRPAVGGRRLGTIIGGGTGLAYGFCNLPGIFSASVNVQAGVAVLAAAIGVAATGALGSDAADRDPAGSDYSMGGVVCWVLLLAALVCLDSAAFYLIQQTPALKEGTWTGAGRLAANAGLHLMAAVLAGLALDRHWLGRVALTGTGALLAGIWLILAGGEWNAAGALLYVAGVSAYSTLLVFYAAGSGRPGLAALVYAVAGWGGSALGIGLVENRAVAPGGLMVAAGAIVAGALLGRHVVCRRAGGSGK